jgi:hypothetical protein
MIQGKVITVWWLLSLALAASFSFCRTAWAQADSASSAPAVSALRITTDALPNGATRNAYKFQIAAEGGTAPLQWRVSKGELCPGLHLDSETGMLVGTPAATGEFAFTVEATDASKQAQTAERELKLKVVPPLSLTWKTPATVDSGGIKGEVEVANGTKDDFDLTVIVLAVNEIGRATALGYQHFKLGQDESQNVPFGASLPPGQYTVHVDAVGEIPEKDVIYRNRLETPHPLARTGSP